MLCIHLIECSHKNRRSLSDIYGFFDSLHRNMYDVIHKIERRIEYTLDLISQYDSYTRMICFFESIQRCWIFRYFCCKNKQSLFSSKLDSFWRVTKLFQSNIIFCTKRGLYDLLRVFWRWRISRQSYLPSERVCSTNNVSDIVGWTDIFKNNDIHDT